MFDLPDAKRVRREDLYDSSSDRHSSPERGNEEDAALRAKLNARLSNLLSLDLGGVPTPPAPANTNEALPEEDGEGQNDGEAEFEFRLFSSSTAAPKVVLASEENEAPYHGPALSQRPVSYYIRGELSPQERETIQSAAVTAQDIVAWAGQRAWGLEVPWRVTKITVTMGGRGSVDGGQRPLESTTGKKSRTKPNKKRRIMLRKRDQAEKEAAAASEKQKTDKEEHLKEKKKRLNREKKLKRRQKEKEKKLAAKSGTGGEAGEAESGSEGSDGEE
ncbi:hypothetical protein C8A00DRAFT_29496 [Chaetomidium leptoderma]|uniref:Uncharacterized protein n=1 Tax=Chaetomidium leptoderma TaxID=669021 RepID=A0AAN6VW76_9PEZI|nr:hypothetical protein C8A00DRAFT_29496 [Chaetomidium leptoderma]